MANTLTARPLKDYEDRTLAARMAIPTYFVPRVGLPPHLEAWLNGASKSPQAPPAREVPKPLLMLPAPKIAGLLPAGALARPVPETAPILNLVSKLRAQIPMTVIPPTRVNPAWVSAWSVAHPPVRGEVGSKRLRAMVEAGTPSEFAAWAFSRIEDAPKRVERIAA